MKQSSRRGAEILEVIVKPGARAPGITREGGAIVLRVRERAIEGAANAACIRALAAEYGVPPSAVTLVGGARSRRKRFAVRQGMPGREENQTPR